MKTVFNNAMVAHVWAQRSQSEGRNSNNSFSFRGSVLYSYRTPIASWRQTVDGKWVVLRTSERYSATTSSKHQPMVTRAVSYDQVVFKVPYIDWFKSESDEHHAHVKNLTYLVGQYHGYVVTAKRAISAYKRRLASLVEFANMARDYAKAFGLLEPELSPVKDFADISLIVEERERKAALPQNVAKRERAAKKREEKRVAKAEADEVRRAENAAQWAKQREERERQEAIDRAKWLSGEDVPHAYFTGTDCSAFLRVKDGQVETSQGAVVPVAHAKRALRFVRKARNANLDWEANGHTIAVGHFTISKIFANGDIRAGCHFIKWAEIEKIAPLLDAAEDNEQEAAA